LSTRTKATCFGDDRRLEPWLGKITTAPSQVLVVTRILPPSMRSNTTETLSAFSSISRVSMGDPGVEGVETLMDIGIAGPRAIPPPAQKIDL
jgi:hypothetical protein